jgi:hypothetical protein
MKICISVYIVKYVGHGLNCIWSLKAPLPLAQFLFNYVNWFHEVSPICENITQEKSGRKASKCKGNTCTVYPWANRSKNCEKIVLLKVQALPWAFKSINAGLNYSICVNCIGCCLNLCFSYSLRFSAVSSPDYWKIHWKPWVLHWRA